jgi:hypothetical protein
MGSWTHLSCVLAQGRKNEKEAEVSLVRTDPFATPLRPLCDPFATPLRPLCDPFAVVRVAAIQGCARPGGTGLLWAPSGLSPAGALAGTVWGDVCLLRRLEFVEHHAVGGNGQRQ